MLYQIQTQLRREWVIDDPPPRSKIGSTGSFAIRVRSRVPLPRSFDLTRHFILDDQALHHCIRVPRRPRFPHKDEVMDKQFTRLKAQVVPTENGQALTI
jgi:hypothetical protein